MKKRKLKKQLLSLALSMILCLCMGLTAFAAEETPPAEAQTIEEEPIVESIRTAVTLGARAASGYAAHYTDSMLDSFYVTVSGSGSLTGKVYLKAWDFPSTADVYVSVFRPDGSTAFANVKLPIGQEISKTITNFQTGTYRIAYQVFGVNRGWMYASFSS